MRKTRTPKKANKAAVSKAAKLAPAKATVPVQWKPHVEFKPVVLPTGNGTFEVHPGKPIVTNANGRDEIGTAEFARLTGLSQRYVQELCAQGRIASRRKSPLVKSELRIPRSEAARFNDIQEAEESGK